MANGNLVFFGTARIALPFLEALAGAFPLPLIVTQPDAAGGRSRRPLPPPVKVFALERSIPCEQPARLRGSGLADRLRELQPAIGVVIAYGKLIPPSIFEIPVHRIVNVHFSLLPRYRGAAPVQRAIENGETATGITIFEIDRGLDSGDVWTRRSFPIGPHETTLDLWERLGREGAPLLTDTVNAILEGRIEKHPQDHRLATKAPIIAKDEGRIDWRESAEAIYNRFRAFQPWPGVYFTLGGKRIRITGLRPLSGGAPGDIEPGRVLGLDRGGWRVACGAGTALEIGEIQPECRRPMTPHDFSLGNPLPERLS